MSTKLLSRATGPLTARVKRAGIVSQHDAHISFKPRRISSVALLTWGFEREVSGLSRAAQLVANALIEHDCAVTVITMDTEEADIRLDGQLSIIGARAWEMPTDRFVRQRAALGHLVAPRIFARCVNDLSLRHSFDVIEATNWFGPSLFLRKLNVPTVVRHSTFATKDYHEHLSVRDKVDRAVAYWVERTAATHADGWISNTQHQREATARQYGFKDCKVHDTIALPLDDHFRERGARASYPNDDRLELLFIGRAEERKGLDDALRAFGLWLEEAEPAVQAAGPMFHMVGLAEHDLAKASKRLGLSQFVMSHIVDHGRVDDDKLFAMIERSHVVLAPSRYESYGLVYREAAAFGRPVIGVADEPAARQLAATTGAMALAQERTPRAIANTLRCLINNREQRLAMGRAGKLYTRNLTLDRFGRETLASYQRVLTHLNAAARV